MVIKKLRRLAFERKRFRETVWNFWWLVLLLSQLKYWEDIRGTYE